MSAAEELEVAAEDLDTALERLVWIVCDAHDARDSYTLEIALDGLAAVRAARLSLAGAQRDLARAAEPAPEAVAS